MLLPNRRTVLLSGAAAALAACDNSVGANGGAVIDNRVRQTLDYMYENHPQSRTLAAQASGMLVMPLMGDAGIMIGGAYGEGALLIDGVTVDYYSAAQASFGLQFGVQHYAYTIFFLSPDSLRQFRTSPGWTGGTDAEITLDNKAASFNADTLTSNQPAVALLFAQVGLKVGATLEGTKYTRILR